MKQIEIACKAAATLPLDKLSIIQGDLKSLSDINSLKLKNSILKYGFSAPIFIWESGLKYQSIMFWMEHNGLVF